MKQFALQVSDINKNYLLTVYNDNSRAIILNNLTDYIVEKHCVDNVMMLTINLSLSELAQNLTAHNIT